MAGGEESLSTFSGVKDVGIEMRTVELERTGWGTCKKWMGPDASLGVHTKLLQSCPTMCNPMDCSLPGSSIHGILQARILKWVAMPSSRGSSLPRD